MRFTPLHTSRLTAVLLAAVALAVGAAPSVRGFMNPGTIPEDEAAIEHALSRLTFGARPGEAAEVRALGLAAWMERQLDPGRIDDGALAPRLPAAPARPERLDSPRDVQPYIRRSIEYMATAKVVRAVHSQRQLEELLVDFWFNHFNVFAAKGRTGLYLAEYEREAIRPHVLGRFRDLLRATAKSPAMLFYLDNWMSVDPAAAERVADTRAKRRARRTGTPSGSGATPAPAALGRRRGLNENYARELLELHTLGVDGGYTQQDIVDVARAFTGWTIAQPSRVRRVVSLDSPASGQSGAPGGIGEFVFTAALHDNGAKRALGVTFEPGGGIRDGERVLDILAAHPSTARHIASKLARRFVSDSPPPALVDRVAARFLETDGDLREVVRAVVTSPEFFDPAARRQKIKTPLEFVTSALRASDRPVQPRVVLSALRELGMPLYLCEPPTGYDDEAGSWMSPGALVARANLAQVLTPAHAAMIATPQFQER